MTADKKEVLCGMQVQVKKIKKISNNQVKHDKTKVEYVLISCLSEVIEILIEALLREDE